jgi:hypothetical protein
MMTAQPEKESSDRACVSIRTGENVVKGESIQPLKGRMNRRNRTSNATLLARGR